MKTNTFNILFSLAILVSIVILDLTNKRNFTKHVKKATVEIYDNYLSVKDSQLTSKQVLSVRETYKQLKLDSISVKMDSATLNLFIVRPFLQKDSTIKGYLHEVYWQKVDRQEIPYFEELR